MQIVDAQQPKPFKGCSADQSALIRATAQSRFAPGQDAKPAVNVIIRGHVFTVRHVVVNRKCYDNFATPTLQIKVDGKRISRAAALAMLA